MARIKGLLVIDGKATAGQAASAANDLVRLGELQTLLQAYAGGSHTHGVAQITDFMAGVLAALRADLGDTQAIAWSVNDSSPEGPKLEAALRVAANGGIGIGADGAYLDSGVVACRGHAHNAAEVSDFVAALRSAVAAYLATSETVEWVDSGSGLEPHARVKSGGGLKASADGLEVDLGTGETQAAPGDHTHAELHPALTVAPSNALTVAVDESQRLTVTLKTGEGLAVSGGNAVVDLGTGASQAARGNHTHAQLHNPVTVGQTASVALSLNGQALTGAVRLNGSPPGGKGTLSETVEGLVVDLGSGASEAAPGTHAHDVATPSRNGFMSTAHVAKLEALTDAGASGAVPVFSQDLFGGNWSFDGTAFTNLDAEDLACLRVYRNAAQAINVVVVNGQIQAEQSYQGGVPLRVDVQSQLNANATEWWSSGVKKAWVDQAGVFHGSGAGLTGVPAREVIRLLTGATPLANETGPEWIVPFAADGTPVVWTVKRIHLRVSTPGGQPWVVVEKGGGVGAFAGVTVGEVQLAADAREGWVTQGLQPVTSGDKLRYRVYQADTAQGWSLQVELATDH
jgi:hypothetical protein